SLPSSIAHPLSTLLFPYTTFFRSQTPAEDVVVNTSGANILTCGASAPGQCTGGQFTFASIPPGQTATATIISTINLARNGDKVRSERHTPELQSLTNLACRLLLAN